MRLLPKYRFTPGSHPRPGMHETQVSQIQTFKGHTYFYYFGDEFSMEGSMLETVIWFFIVRALRKIKLPILTLRRSWRRAV